MRDISVAPLEASDQALIIKMMDESDGVMAVRRRKKNSTPVNPINAAFRRSRRMSDAEELLITEKV